MPTFKSYSKARTYIEKAVSEALANEVNSAVQKVEKDVIRKTVYQAYEPKVYQRRNSLYNLEGTVAGKTLEVKTLAEPNGAGVAAGYDNPAYDGMLKASTNKNLARTIEYGGYSNNGGDGYDFYDVGPRPFVQTTVETLAAGKQHVAALKQGLRKKGITVE